MSKGIWFTVALVSSVLLSALAGEMETVDPRQRLLRAVETNDLPEAKAAFMAGADPGAIYTQGTRSSPIVFLAIKLQASGMAELFLDQGLSPYASHQDLSLIHVAAAFDYRGDFLRRLLAKDPGLVALETQNFSLFGSHPLVIAAGHVNLEAIRQLLQAGADPIGRVRNDSGLPGVSKTLLAVRDEATRGVCQVRLPRREATALLLQKGAPVTNRVLQEFSELAVPQDRIFGDSGSKPREPGPCMSPTETAHELKDLYRLLLDHALRLGNACASDPNRVSQGERLSALKRRRDELRKDPSAKHEDHWAAIVAYEREQADLEDAGCVALTPEFQEFAKGLL